MSKKRIDRLVNGLLEFYGCNPNTLHILRDMGIDVVYVDKSSPRLSGNNSRVILSLNAIFIRNDLNDFLKAFYLKHELGHILLHTDEKNILLPKTGRREIEANYFAYKLSNVQLDEIGMRDMTLEQIASCVNIPYEVMNQLVYFFKL